MYDKPFEMIKYLRAKEDTGALEIVYDEINWRGFRLHIKVGLKMWKRVIKPQLQQLVPGSFGDRVLFKDEPSSHHIFLYHSRRTSIIDMGGSIPLDDL